MRTLSRAYLLAYSLLYLRHKIRDLYSKQWPVHIVILKMRQHFVSGCNHKTKLNWLSSSWPILSSQLPAEPICRSSRDRAHLENKEHPIKLWEMPIKVPAWLSMGVDWTARTPAFRITFREGVPTNKGLVSMSSTITRSYRCIASPQTEAIFSADAKNLIKSRDDHNGKPFSVNYFLKVARYPFWHLQSQQPRPWFPATTVRCLQLLEACCSTHACN